MLACCNRSTLKTKHMEVRASNLSRLHPANNPFYARPEVAQIKRHFSVFYESPVNDAD